MRSRILLVLFGLAAQSALAQSSSQRVYDARPDWLITSFSPAIPTAAGAPAYGILERSSVQVSDWREYVRFGGDGTIAGTLFRDTCVTLPGGVRRCSWDYIIAVDPRDPARTLFEEETTDDQTLTGMTQLRRANPGAWIDTSCTLVTFNGTNDTVRKRYVPLAAVFDPSDSSAIILSSGLGIVRASLAGCVPFRNQAYRVLLPGASLLAAGRSAPLHIAGLTTGDTLCESFDRGATWRRTHVPLIGDLIEYPDHRVQIAARTSGVALRSADSGRTFVPSSMMLSPIAVDTANGVAYGARGPTLYASFDSGLTFSVYNNAFSNATIRAIVPNFGGHLAVVTTDGIYWILGPAQAVEERMPSNAAELLTVYPNPSTGSITVSSSMPGAGVVTVTDLVGRVVFRRAFAPGAGPVEFRGLPCGTYIGSARSGDILTSRMIEVFGGR